MTSKLRPSDFKTLAIMRNAGIAAVSRKVVVIFLRLGDPAAPVRLIAPRLFNRGVHALADHGYVGHGDILSGS